MVLVIVKEAEKTDVNADSSKDNRAVRKETAISENQVVRDHEEKVEEREREGERKRDHHRCCLLYRKLQQLQ